jgi:hypothetical protein
MAVANKLLQVRVCLKEQVSILQIWVQLALPPQPVDVLRTHEVAVSKAAGSQSTTENTTAFLLLVHTRLLVVSAVTT